MWGCLEIKWCSHKYDVATNFRQSDIHHTVIHCNQTAGIYPSQQYTASHYNTVHHIPGERKSLQPTTRWRRPMENIIFIGHFPKRALKLGTLWWKETYNMRHPLHLRHRVPEIPIVSGCGKESEIRPFFLSWVANTQRHHWTKDCLEQLTNCNIKLVPKGLTGKCWIP